jgi:hypothetical protein
MKRLLEKVIHVLYVIFIPDEETAKMKADSYIKTYRHYL